MKIGDTYSDFANRNLYVSSLSRFASKRQTASGLHVEVLQSGTHQSGAEQNREVAKRRHGSE